MDCFPETTYQNWLKIPNFTCAIQIFHQNLGPTDSLGGAINHNEFVQFLGGEYRYMSIQTQELFSSVCGQHCIFYMSLRARGHSMDDIVHVLDI